MSEAKTELTVLTTEIIAAYVENNRGGADALPTLMRAVYGALNGLGVGVAGGEVEQPKATVPQVRKSITDAGLISLIDGKTHQTLKRHIGRLHTTPSTIGLATAVLPTSPTSPLPMPFGARN
ncbi:MucR family transcriptional regulator [Brevundimonas sp. 1080]|uniref:MucR family transcriptional regulator n=1 Tax=Brevundimonas sp. 1080 TaxID=3156405 RepID=UPI00339B4D68